MDNKTYSAWRDGFLAEQMPYRAVQPQELISTGENTYILNGLELTVKPEICSQIDTFMGVTHHQSKSVTDTFGSDGIRDFRNYLALSNNNERYGKLALIADPEKRAALEAQHLLGLGQVTDISNACIYLLSDASRWVTGANLMVDGGYTAK
jgi:hypothetical protein